jgi:uncharacterized membrane protein YhhN
MIRLRAAQWVALAAYAIAGEALALATAGGWPGVAHAARLVLMPLLVVIVLAARPQPRDRWVMAGGLALATAADLTVLDHSAAARIAGQVLVLGAWLAYAVAFLRGGAIDGLRVMPLIAVAYALIFAVVLALAWGRLGGSRFLALGYGLALTLMAACAATFGPFIGTGGGLLMASQALIALGLAHDAGGAAVVALLYVAGHALVAVGWTRVQVRESATWPLPSPAYDPPAHST